MFTREDKIVNPEHLKNSSFKITRRADNLSALDFMFQGTEPHSSYQQQNHLFKQMKDREYKEKGELKATLLAQIREKETNKKSEKMNDFHNPYTSRDYNFKHHPINNPVDVNELLAVRAKPKSVNLIVFDCDSIKMLAGLTSR